MKASGVSRTPSCVALPFNATRAISKSVMSASSCCVTCGMLSQLACRRAPEIRWMRDSGLSSTAPNFAKSTSGTLGSADTGAGGARTGAVRMALHMRFHILLSDAPLRPGALDLAEIRAELAREFAHRRARVRFGKRRFVDLRRGGRHFWRARPPPLSREQARVRSPGPVVEPPARAGAGARSVAGGRSGRRRSSSRRSGRGRSSSLCSSRSGIRLRTRPRRSSSNISEPSETLSP